MPKFEYYMAYTPYLLELLFNMIYYIEMLQDLCGLHKCSHSAMKNLQALLTILKIYAKI